MSANKGLSSNNIIGEFYRRLDIQQGNSWVDDVSMYFQSDQEAETYKWLGMAPSLSEHVGGRQVSGFRENGVTIRNVVYDASLAVPRDWERRDKTGQIMVRVEEMAQGAVRHWEKLVTQLINDGVSNTCYDGQFFFDTDHSEGRSGTQSNDLTVDISTIETADVPTAPTAKQAKAMVMAGVKAILGMKDDRGEPMNETARNFTILVPVTLWDSFSEAVLNPFIGNGESNVIQHLGGYQFDLQSTARLTWTDAIAVMRTDGSAKPFILQEEKPLALEALGPGSDHYQKHREWLFTAEAIRGAGYGYWQHAARVQAV